VRRLGKYDSGPPYTGEFFPSAALNFFETPFTNKDDPEGWIYWIQSNDRQTKCPDFSWLAVNNDECASGEARLDIHQVSIVEKTLWKLSKKTSVDKYLGTDCVYYTIDAWDPPFAELACSTGGYGIDLFDRFNPNTAGLGNSTDNTTSQRNFRLPRFEGSLLPGESWCNTV
jgi:hypothetical protein